VLVPLTGVNCPSDDTEPAFSMDALRLAFVRDTLGHKRIRLLAAGTTPKFMPLPGLDSLTAAFDDESPAPDLTGEYIVFVSNREGAPHLYRYERAAGHVDTLLVTRAADGIEADPAITADRHFVCFASNRAGGRGGFDIYLYNLTTGQPVPLPGVNTAFDERHPSLNATGTAVAYQSDSSSTGTWCIRYYVIGSSSAPATIGRNDPSANDVQPSMVFP
jgi:Tol biopolymer transport system component